MSRQAINDWWPEDGPTRGTCNHCGERDVLVKLTVDPYEAEVHPNEPNEPSYWCYPCYNKSANEI